MTRREREADLRADAALGELDPRDARELASLAREREDASYEIAAAAVAAAHAEATPMPAHLAKKVMADAEAFFAAPRSAQAATSAKSTTAAGAQVIVMPVAADAARPRIDYARWGGWIAAAACLVIVATQALAPRPLASGTATAATTARRAPLHAAGAAGEGELAWNARDQRGTLHARSLAPSAPGEEYEVWIVDDARDGETVVPVGHFAVPPGAGELDVAVQAPVQITDPRRVLVTFERAGGVLASARARVALEGGFVAP